MNMPAVTERVTLEEFDLRYGQEKPYFEYWHGEPVQKSMPNWIHGLLQVIIIDILREVGFQAGAEIRLKIDLDLQLLPDVIGTKSRPEIPYPTQAVEVAVEILSPGDSISHVKQKCQAYAGWGFKEIYVLDPERTALFRWEAGDLHEVDTFVRSVPASEIWQRLHRAVS